MEKIVEKGFNHTKEKKDNNLFSSFFGDLFKNNSYIKEDSFFKLFKDLFSGKTDNFFGRLFSIFRKKEDVIKNTKRETQSLKDSLVGGVENMVLKRKGKIKDSGETINPGIKGFLSFIRKVEGNNNYNAINGQPNQSVIDFTNMSIKEVLVWQDKNKKAVGAYQFKRGTLRDLCKANNIDLNKNFDINMQDKLAILRIEYRGLKQYKDGIITIDKFQQNLSKEWAAFPKDNSGKSFYRGVGNNKALVSSSELRQHLKSLV